MSHVRITYDTFQKTAPAPVSAMICSNTYCARPRRSVSCTPRPASVCDSAAREWCSHQCAAAPGRHWPGLTSSKI